MKKLKVCLSSMSMVALLLLASCDIPMVKMHTTINEDGTCMREVNYSYAKQKSSLGSGQKPSFLNIDGYETLSDIEKGDTVTKVFSRTFENVEEMSKNTPFQINERRLQPKTIFEKHCRWFYTEYTYTETFTSLGDTLLVPLTKYFDKETVDKIMSGSCNPMESLYDAKKSQKQEEMSYLVFKWFNDECLNFQINYIVAHYESIPNPPVTRERFVEQKDSLISYLLDEKNGNEKEGISDYYHSGAYEMFFNEENPYGKELSEGISKHVENLWLNTTYTLTMPGTVTDSGNGTLNGDKITYFLSGVQFISKDFVITATSHITHLWAYIVTILVPVLLIGYLLYRRRTKEKELEIEELKKD